MRLPFAISVVLGCILAAAPKAAAQSDAASSKAGNSTTAPSTAKSSSGEKKPAAAASGNAFPQAQSEAAARAAQQQAEPPPASSNAAPRRPPTSGGKSAPKSPAADNPFPEAQSQAAAQKDESSGSPSATEPQAQSGSSGGYSSSSQDLPPSDVGQGQTRRDGSAKEDTYTMDKHPETRIKNDLDVADFYFKNGNSRGAYLRYQDTLKYDPANETALFGSAMAMCKQNLTQDALQDFRDYLAIYPRGKYTKRAAAVVAHPERCTHNP
jgi:hypothetical protein